MICNQFCCLVCGVLAAEKLLPYPKEAVADPQPKYLVFGWWHSPIQLLNVLMETGAEPTWVSQQ